MITLSLIWDLFFLFICIMVAMRLQDKISCKPLKSSTTRSTLMGFYLFTPEGKLSIFFFVKIFVLFSSILSLLYIAFGIMRKWILDYTICSVSVRCSYHAVGLYFGCLWCHYTHSATRNFLFPYWLKFEIKGPLS